MLALITSDCVVRCAPLASNGPNHLCLRSIDLKQFLEPSDDSRELRGGHSDGAADLANAMSSLQHTLATNFDFAAGMGAIGAFD